MNQIVNESNLYALVACIFFCFCVLLYNAYSLHRRDVNKRKMPQRIDAMHALAGEQVRHVVENGRIDIGIQRRMAAKLRDRENLFAVEQIYPLLIEEAPFEAVSQAMTPLIEAAVERCSKRNELEHVYLASLIQLYDAFTEENCRFLLAGLKSSSFYTRLQCLRCIALLGHEGTMLEALRTIGGRHLLDNEKCVTDALMDYVGDREGLVEGVMRDFRSYNTVIQRAVVGFLTNVRSIGFCRELLDMMEAPRTDKELRIALLKFFTAVRYDSALPAIIRLAQDEDWEYAAIAAKALGVYPYRESVAQLKSRVMNPNWYVRYNCALSLARLCPVSELQDVLNGNDRYAREIMQYALTQIHERP